MNTLGKLLQGKYSIVEFQQRGNVHLNDLLTDLKSFLENCSSDRILVGHSWGATLINLYIRRNQEKAVFISPAPLTNADANAFAKNLSARFPEIVIKEMEELKNKEANADRNELQKLKQRRLELISPYYHFRPKTEAALAGLQWDFHSFSVLMDEAWELIDKGELGPLKVPVIHGSHDPIPTLPYAEIIKEAGHFPWLENAVEFMQSFDGAIKILRN